MIRPAGRLAHIAPFEVMEVLGRAQAMQAAGHDVIHLEVGEPDFATPAPIIAAARAALVETPMGYTSALGLDSLREQISHHYRHRFGVSVPPERIIVTAGSSAALLMALGALVDPGDRVLISDPGYPCNRHFVRTLDGQPVLVPTGPETSYQLTADLVRSAGTGARVVIAASPSNPTGTRISLPEWAAIAEVCRQTGTALIADEIYQGLTYDSEPETVLSVADDVFVVNSFSKYFQMTGWRLGWLVVPDEWVRPIERLAQNLFICPPTPAQYAALAAFTPETTRILEQRRVELAARRDMLIDALPGIGFAVRARPDGAFYVYCDTTELSTDSFDLCATIIERTAVAITPGRDFGVAAPEQHVRIAYTQPVDRLAEAIDRIGAVVRT